MALPNRPDSPFSVGHEEQDWEDDSSVFAPLDDPTLGFSEPTVEEDATPESSNASPFMISDEDDLSDDFSDPEVTTPNEEHDALLTNDDDDDDDDEVYGVNAPVEEPEPTPLGVDGGPVVLGTPLFTEETTESIELLLEAIRSDDSSEVIMNGPNEVTMKQDGVRYHLPDIKFHDAETYHRVINEALLPWTDTAERITPQSFLVEGQLELPVDDGASPPMMARVHILAPPVTKFAKVTIAKKSRHSYNLDDIRDHGAMNNAMAEFLKACARGRVTTVFSGLSGAGKTTLLEASSHYFDENDRVVVVEDTKELRLPIADTVYLTTSAHKPGVPAEQVVTMEWLVRATNRMRPDRIVVGEVRGGEMSEFLVAANSGADGSMTTVHASDPRRTLDKMLSLAMKADGTKSESSVRRDIASTVQLIVQLGLIDGRHYVLAIEEISSIIRQDSGTISTNPIFQFDRNTGRHRVTGRPSDEFMSFLQQRGVEINMAWFR